MKKMILMIIASSSFMFAQTGMVTDSGMGVWLNTNAIDMSDNEADAQYALSFDYVMDTGLELGLDYWLDDAKDGQMDFGLMYHMKCDEDGMNWNFGLNMMDVSEEAGDMTTVLSGGGYTSSLMHFGLHYDLDADADEISVSFGKLFAMDSMTLGVGYTANTADIGEGWLTLSAGTTF